ncbi:MAG: CopG family transcriptional regulator [Brachybacterium faecium]|nr:MAG: CopG family transcriptional regulator [Brachybacterium faecium]
MKIEDLIASEAAAAEANKDAELRPGTTVTRGRGRARTLQVRLNEDELARLTALAASRGIPTSTLARELLMSQVRAGGESPQAVIARLRSDLDALASTVR